MCKQNNDESSYLVDNGRKYILVKGINIVITTQIRKAFDLEILISYHQLAYLTSDYTMNHTNQDGILDFSYV